MITVITPTYNRCHTLPRLWESLCNQSTQYPFEWILVDDGSTDGTKSWFEALDTQRSCTRRYVYQANQGKHVALNTAVSKANGLWCLIVDSDDALTADAISRLKSDIDAIGCHESIVGICYRRQEFDGGLIGRVVKRQSTEMTPNDAAELFKGDLAYVFRTSVLLAHPFPVITSEKFVPELLVWNRIADFGRIRYFPDTAIYFCQYLSDGYSASFKRMLRQNPRGFGLFYFDQIKRLSIGLAWLKAVVRLAQCWFYRLQQ